MNRKGYRRGGRARLFWAALVLLICNPVFGAEQHLPPVSGNPVHGRDVFVGKRCIRCHSIRGSGGKIGPDLAAALVGKGTAGIAAAMVSHYPKMHVAMHENKVPRPILSFAEMDDLVAYLFFINFTEEPGNVENGERLFTQKGCVNCHAAVLGSHSPAPPIGRFSLSMSPASIAQEMWNHVAQGAATKRGAPAKLARGEMADLLAYIGSAHVSLPKSSVNLLPGDAAAGRALFQTKGCTECHLKHDGGTCVGPDLSTAAWYEDATEFAGEMWNHASALRKCKADLSTVPRFTDGEMADLIAYLYLLRSAGGRGNPSSGAEVFSAKHCAQCHKPGGHGPDLRTVPGLNTPTHFAAAMWDHAQRMHTFVAAAGLPWPNFDASDIVNLLAFLNQPQTTNTPGRSRSPVEKAVH